MGSTHDVSLTLLLSCRYNSTLAILCSNALLIPYRGTSLYNSAFHLLHLSFSHARVIYGEVIPSLRQLVSESDAVKIR